MTLRLASAVLVYLGADETRGIGAGLRHEEGVCGRLAAGLSPKLRGNVSAERAFTTPVLKAKAH